MKSPVKTWATLALVSAFTLSACGGNSTEETNGDASSGNGQDLIVAASEPNPNLIPSRQTTSFGMMMTIFSPLTFLEEDGTLTYMQAESVESEDDTTWTITLREGWTFHDGSPVTANDYVSTWNWAAYGPNAVENSGMLANIVGFDDLNPSEGDPETEEMSGLRVIDDLTFEVELDGPDSQFPMQLSQGQSATFPMPEAAFDDLEAYGAHPIGNGPYAITQGHVEGESIVAEAYEDYAGEPGTSETITWVPYTDQVTAYNDALAGNVDVAGLPTDRLTQAANDFGEDRVHSFEGPGIMFLGMPAWDDRYDDVRVRQAISMAIDRETINQVIYGGLFEPASAWTPAVMPGTPVGICGEFCEYDPDAAADLLEEAGGFEGEMTIYYPGGGGSDGLYDAIANNIRQNLGIEAVASPTADWAEFSTRRSEEDFDGPFFSRWGALYPSQQATMREVFLPTGGCNNCAVPSLEQVADALAEADATDDGSGEAYVSVQEILAEEFVVPPLFFENYNRVTSERVEELPSSVVDGPLIRSVVLKDE